jgi:proteasome lid subunit RPN8/RPN11
MKVEGSVLRVRWTQLEEMVAHCLHALPHEGCGLLVGDPERGEVVRVVPTTNTAASARVYSVDPLEHLRTDPAAEAEGLAVIGVFHSHTHTDPYPSPTDVAQAPDPGWHYVLVSLRDEVASTRSYRIVGGQISEEPVLAGEPADEVSAPGADAVGLRPTPMTQTL